MPSSQLFSNRLKLVVLFAAGLIVSSLGGLAANPVAEVLVLGPIPASHWIQVADDKPRDQALQNALERLVGDKLPGKTSTAEIFGKSFAWQVRQTATVGVAGGTENDTRVLSFNMETVRYTQGTLTVRWPGEMSLFQQRQPLKVEKEEPNTHRFSLSATTGSHHFLAVLKGGTGPLEILWDQGDQAGQVIFHVEPQARVRAQQLFHAPVVRTIDLSPDGKWLALGKRGWDSDKEAFVSDFEIRSFADHRRASVGLKHTPSQFHWRPDSDGFAYHAADTFWVQQLGEADPTKVMAAVQNMQILGWHPSGRSLLVSLTQEAKKDRAGVKRYQALEDRWSNWRKFSQIGQIDIGSGVLQIWTQEAFGTSFLDVDSAGKRLLYTTSPPKYDKPPHQVTVLKELNLETGSARTMGEFTSLNQVEYGHGGYYLSAGPSAFDGIGKMVPAEKLANDYDTQLYFWDGADQVQALTKYFDPSIIRYSVLSDDRLLLHTVDQDKQSLYLMEKDQNLFKTLDAGVEVVERLDVSTTRKPKIVLTGTSANTPQKIYTMGLSGKTQVWDESGNAPYQQTFFGEVKPWHFTNEAGAEIIGRYYTPPGFSQNNRYPLIVYYYGGTVPVNRQFTGRYPFNLWAAHGYVVYVLQPSGTIGMGQAFSSLHVNAWGKDTAEDIITGTGQFIRAHTFIDSTRVGCIGASYGGFMTMNLITKTPFYRAAISHAGISDLSSYWGEGWWGFAYSGIATQGRFPWNHSEFYAEVSPLSYADKISTPLLLLHGDADTNVPPGQSHHMYTALKLLNKEVELVTFDGENHHILNPKQRLLWWDTILAWFDKQLKGQDTWWEELYPTP